MAVFKLPALEQTALSKTGKAPMGFGIPTERGHALVCHHDDAVVSRLDLAAGKIMNSFATGNGGEFVEYY